MTEMQVINNWHSIVKCQKKSKWHFRNSWKTHYLHLYCESCCKITPELVLLFFPVLFLWQQYKAMNFYHWTFFAYIKKDFKKPTKTTAVKYWKLYFNAWKTKKWNLVSWTPVPLPFDVKIPSHMTIYKEHIL